MDGLFCDVKSNGGDLVGCDNKTAVGRQGMLVFFDAPQISICQK